MATRNTLAEQIQLSYRRAVGADTALKFVVDRREIFPLINQVANELLGTVIQNSIKVGDILIPSSIIATYSNNPVRQEHGRYVVQLPVHPLILPRNIGIFSVVPQTGPSTALIDGVPFIPLTQEDWDLLRATDEGLLEGQIGFYAEGRKIFFTANPVVTAVKLKLLISDPNLIGDNEPYPITPELEATLIERVLQILKENTANQQKPESQDR